MRKAESGVLQSWLAGDGGNDSVGLGSKSVLRGRWVSCQVM